MSGFALFNATIERIAYRPLRNAPRLSPLITAVGMSFIVNNIGLALYGVNYKSVPNFIPKTDLITIGNVSYTWSKASVLIITIPLLIVLSYFVSSTKQGKAMRAVAQDTEASAMMGIDVNRTISVTFLIAGSLAGAAGIIYLLQFNMRYDTGFELGLIAFTAAVLGGIGNLTGRRPRRPLHRLHPGVQRGSRWLAPGERLDAVDGLRDPDPRARLPPGGHPRRTDTGGCVSDIGTRARSLTRNRSHVVVAGLIVLTLVYPSIYDSLSSLPLIGDFVPKTDALVIMIAYTMMAVGLNIVVGYAGLLDLGYVAFYAVGAYTAGWFASVQFDQRQFHFGAVGISDSLPGLHISMWLVLPIAGLSP